MAGVAARALSLAGASLGSPCVTGVADSLNAVAAVPEPCIDALHGGRTVLKAAVDIFARAVRAVHAGGAFASLLGAEAFVRLVAALILAPFADCASEAEFLFRHMRNAGDGAGYVPDADAYDAEPPVTAAAAERGADLSAVLVCLGKAAAACGRSPPVEKSIDELLIELGDAPPAKDEKKGKAGKKKGGKGAAAAAAKAPLPVVAPAAASTATSAATTPPASPPAERSATTPFEPPAGGGDSGRSGSGDDALRAVPTAAGQKPAAAAVAAAPPAGKRAPSSTTGSSSSSSSPVQAQAAAEGKGGAKGPTAAAAPAAASDDGSRDDRGAPPSTGRPAVPSPKADSALPAKTRADAAPLASSAAAKATPGAAAATSKPPKAAVPAASAAPAKPAPGAPPAAAAAAATAQKPIPGSVASAPPTVNLQLSAAGGRAAKATSRAAPPTSSSSTSSSAAAPAATAAATASSSGGSAPARVSEPAIPPPTPPQSAAQAQLQPEPSRADVQQRGGAGKPPAAAAPAALSSPAAPPPGFAQRTPASAAALPSAPAAASTPAPSQAATPPRATAALAPVAAPVAAPAPVVAPAPARVATEPSAAVATAAASLAADALAAAAAAADASTRPLAKAVARPAAFEDGIDSAGDSSSGGGGGDLLSLAWLKGDGDSDSSWMMSPAGLMGLGVGFGSGGSGLLGLPMQPRQPPLAPQRLLPAPHERSPHHPSERTGDGSMTAAARGAEDSSSALPGKGLVASGGLQGGVSAAAAAAAAGDVGVLAGLVHSLVEAKGDAAASTQQLQRDAAQADGVAQVRGVKWLFASRYRRAHLPFRPAPLLCPRLQLLVHAGAALAEMNRNADALRAQLATQEAALLQVSATAAQRVAQLEHELRSRGLAVPAPLPPPIITPSPSSGSRTAATDAGDSSGLPGTFLQSAAGGGSVGGGNFMPAGIESSAASRDSGTHTRPGSRFAGPDALPFLTAEQVTRQRAPSDGSESDGREAHQQAPGVSQTRSPPLQSHQQLQQQHFQMQPQLAQQLHFAPGTYMPLQHSAFALQPPGFMAPGPVLQLSHAAPPPPAPAPLPSAASAAFMQHYQQQQQQQHQSLMQSRLQPPPGILAALQPPPEHAFPQQLPQQQGPTGAPSGHGHHGPHGTHGAAFMLGASPPALPLQPPQAFLRGGAAQQPASLPPGLLGQSHGPPGARWQ